MYDAPGYNIIVDMGTRSYGLMFIILLWLIGYIFKEIHRDFKFTQPF